VLGASDEQAIEAPPGPAEQAPTFYKSQLNPALEQGDLIPREATVVREVVAKYHDYHVKHPENEMFAVLTQSCDLYRREGSCKARYIALAPVRTLRNVLRQEFDSVLVRTPGNLYTLGSDETKARYVDFLTRLINNNDSRHFYLPENHAIGMEDMCILLALSIPIKVEHYDSCVRDRVAQLDDLFQAKLGWLLGQQYSRVGTPDWPDQLLQQKVVAVTDRTLSWFPPNDFEQVKRMLEKFATDYPDKEVDEGELASLVKRIKNRKQLAIDTVFKLMDELLVDGKFPPAGPDRFQLRKKLTSNDEFAKFFPNS
jgi:hypothetical protein